VTPQRLARVACGLGTITIVVLSLLPATDLPDLGLSDKLEHAAAYGLVAALGALGWAGHARARVVLSASLVGLGIALELLQSFVPGRTTDPVDALANLAGTLLGVGVVAAMTRFAARASRLGQPGR
jgi:VanZ family protein